MQISFAMMETLLICLSLGGVLAEWGLQVQQTSLVQGDTTTISVTPSCEGEPFSICSGAWWICYNTAHLRDDSKIASSPACQQAGDRPSVEMFRQSVTCTSSSTATTRTLTTYDLLNQYVRMRICTSPVDTSQADNPILELSISSKWATSTSVAPATSTSVAGDPHLRLAGGGEADFHGRDKTIFSFLSVPRLSVNVMTVDRSFVRWNKQIVHGSFVTRAHIKFRNAISGVTYRVGVLAEQLGTFRFFKDDIATNQTDDASMYKNMTVLSGEGFEAVNAKGELNAPCRWCVYVRAAGWEVLVHHRRVRKPLIGGRASVESGYAPSKAFLDVSFRVVDQDPGLVKKVGHSSLGRIAPHGIIGQSFDGSGIAVSGKMDSYGNEPAFTTSAQAEGAIEGTYTDYIAQGPFSTNFKYSRFSTSSPTAPRNVTALMGAKAPAADKISAGSVELHGVDHI